MEINNTYLSAGAMLSGTVAKIYAMPACRTIHSGELQGYRGSLFGSLSGARHPRVDLEGEAND